MLRDLHIENIAVIKNADIHMYDGFTVLTGETGSGKSVIIDCLSLIAGEKISRDCVRYGEDEGVVEACFENVGGNVMSILSDNGIECPDGEVIIRCTMSSDGKLRARINGKSVTRTLQRQVGKLLLSVCSQDEGRELYREEVYIPMLDSYMGDIPEKEEYSTLYSEICEVRARLNKILASDASVARERDMLRYQINDIDSKKLRAGEEEKLEQELLRLCGAEKINKQVSFAYKALRGAEKGNAAYLLSRSASALSLISDIIPEMKEYSARLTDMSYEIDDIAECIKEHLDALEGDPTERIDEIQARLSLISSLKKRYGDSISEILRFRQTAAERLDEIDNSEEIADKWQKKLSELVKKACAIASRITEKRKSAAISASKEMLSVLRFLDMPSVCFDISVTEDELNEHGRDKVSFLIATNPGEAMLPMDRIVSGGEMSRITLALRCVMNEKDGIGCTVYDEIDTGISGKTSRKIGIKLKDVSRKTQVISVTHSAQIATLADRHYLIKKNEVMGRAQTECVMLERDGRIMETARILGGINITEAQIQAAVDMLADGDLKNIADMY